MFLKEFSVRRYGPLPDSGVKKTGAFTLFSGPNEEGKTLTIDALLRMMFGKGVRQFKAIKRVDEDPDGYLVIEDRERKEHKLPGAGTLEDLFGLGSSEFANIFVIRDSDLSISNENMFYRDITNRLTGLRSGEINEIINRIQDLGGVTPGGEYQNVAPVKLKDRIRKARSLAERVEELLVKLNEEGFIRFEEELSGLETVIREKTERLSLLRAAQNRELYEKGKAALRQLKMVIAEAEELKSFSRDDLEAWQRLEISLNHYRSDLEHLERDVECQQEAVEASRNILNEKKLACKKADYETAAASEKAEPLLDEYETQYLSVQEQQTLVDSTFYNRILLVSILVFLLSLAGSIAQAAWWFLTLLAVSLPLALALLWYKYRFIKKKGKLAEIEARVCSEAEKAGLPADNIAEIRAGIGNLKNGRALAAVQLSEAETDLQWQRKEAERLREAVQEKLVKIREAEEKIDKISQDSGLDTIDLYRALLERQEKCRSDAEKQSGVLSSHFGEAPELSSGEDRTLFWQKRLNEIQEYAEAAGDIKYDQKEFAGLSGELEELGREAEALDETIRERHDELRDIEKGINELFQEYEESTLPCQTTVDLEVIRQKLERWILEHETDRANARAAVEILNTLGKEEEKKVTALFGSDNPVSGYFSQITGGRYREVLFESSSNMIRVVRDDGTELDADRLSGGAYDQLYFSIRMALGEKLLEGNKGFFILDDPFIKADPERLNLLLAMLERICSEGWQILLFSSKGEIKEALQQKIERGEVRELTVS